MPSTRSLSPLATAIALFSTASCAWIENDGSPRLRPGLRVEAQGRVDRPGIVDDLEEKASDDRLEARGGLQVAEDGQLSLLGAPLLIDDDTEFENADKDELDEPPEWTDGLWVFARGRGSEDGFRVRKLRLQEPRGKWEIEGIVDSLDGQIPDSQPATFTIGPYKLQTRTGTDVQLLDPLREWRSFLDDGPLARRVANEEKFLPYTVEVGPNTRLGGQFSFAYDHEDDLDLRRDRNRDQDTFQTRTRLSLLHRLGEEAFVLLEGQVFNEIELKDGNPNERTLELEPAEVYVFLPNVVTPGLHLQIGRQNIDEQREWLYDENLDAVRATLEGDPISFEASLSQTPRLLEEGNRAPSVNAIALAHLRVSDDWILSAYVIDRRSRELDDFSPFHYGLRSVRDLRTGLSHWIDLSRVDGIVDGRRLLASAADAGVTWVGSHDLQPSFTLGYAWGQGNRPRGRRNRTFRQTGLQDNNGKWNGVTTFRYYGEVLDPELSNLHVLTAGIGVRPDRRSSIDVAFHTYRQDTAIADQLVSDLRAQPNGRRRRLGREIDLIIGIRRPRFAAEWIAGLFTPGPAFERRDPAFFTSFQLRFKF